MRVRTITACTAAVALTALLLPGLGAGAAASPPPGAHRPAPPGCSVVADPDNSHGTPGAPVIEDTELGFDPSNPDNAVNGGYYVIEKHYPRSSTFVAEIPYTPPATGGCGTISVLTFPYVGTSAEDAVVLADAVQSTTAVLSGQATKVVITSLVVGLPAESRRVTVGESGEEHLCVASQVEVRDDNGTVVQTFPAAGPKPMCPGSGGGKVYGG